MRRGLVNASAIALFACFVSGFGFAVWSAQQAQPHNHELPTKSNQPDNRTGNLSASPRQEHHSSERSQDQSWYDKFRDHITDWLLVIFNGILAAFTVRLFYATRGLVAETAGLRTAADEQRVDMLRSIEASEKLASATNDVAKTAITSNQIAVYNAEQQLRAYVSARDLNLIVYRKPAIPGAYIQIEGAPHTYGFAAILRNGGQTPAINIKINVSCNKLAKALPADFAFPDSDLFGHGLIGPNSEIHTPPIRVAAQEIESIEINTGWYLWGWIEYDDIFTRSGSTSRHRTEFCFQIDRERLPVTNEFWIGFKP